MRSKFGIILAGAAAAMMASLSLASAPAHEVVARSRPTGKRRTAKSPALAATYGTRAERRAGLRAAKKHRLKGLRP